jgi:hypothetical protein
MKKNKIYFNFFLFKSNYLRVIEKLVKRHLENDEIDLAK